MGLEKSPGSRKRSRSSIFRGSRPSARLRPNLTSPRAQSQAQWVCKTENILQPLYDDAITTGDYKAYLFSIRLCSRKVNASTNHIDVHHEFSMGDVVTIHGCERRAIIRSIRGHVSYGHDNLIRLRYTRLPITPASLTLPAL